MPKYQIRLGAALPHEGTVLPEGAIVELPRALAAEFPHLVDELVEGPPAAYTWQRDLAETDASNHPGLLAVARASVEVQTAEATAAITGAQQALDNARARLARLEAELQAIGAAWAPPDSAPEAKE